MADLEALHALRPLTGLGNRRALERNGAHLLRSPVDPHFGAAVLDVDDLLVNDRFGRAGEYGAWPGRAAVPRATARTAAIAWAATSSC
jgi:GGDEF domain-containing protein